MRYFLLIPQLKIHNANALSSPYTIGFPAMTAWLGAMHYLQRQIQQQYAEIECSQLAISCHAFDLQTYKGQGDFIYSIIGTANPLDKSGERPAFIEEARCHLTVSLLVELHISPQFLLDHKSSLLTLCNQIIGKMKFAGGDVLNAHPCEIIYFDDSPEHYTQELRLILNKLMLGYVLIERRDLIQKTMTEDHKDALDAILDYLVIRHTAHQISTADTSDEQYREHHQKIVWTATRKEPGWLIPIAVGFQGISDPSIARNQRDPETLHRFAESILTLGEFKMPYRITRIDDILWHYHTDLENNLYVCRQTQHATKSE